MHFFRLALVGLVSLAILQAPGGKLFAQTVAGDTARGRGSYLRGMGWYNLNSAKAASIDVDATIRWKADLRRIANERLEQLARQEAGKKLQLEQVKQRQLERQRELRTSPNAADIQSGEALNALLFDLTDPGITTKQWRTHVVPLPKNMSVKDLIFQFTPTSGASTSSKVLSRGVIALSRLDNKGNWPTVMKFESLDQERHNYETAYAHVHSAIIKGQFDMKVLQELDASLEALKKKVGTAVPFERGYRAEAQRYVDDLVKATRFFDAATVDYAQEMLVDTQNHDAKTVAELVAFALKFRLQFASSERSPETRVLYGKVYEALLKQTKEFSNGPAHAKSTATPKIPADAVKYKHKHYLAIAEKVSWHLARKKCAEMGGRLVVIEDSAENEFVTQLATKAKLDTIWLGASDEEKEGEWVWVTGQPVKYSNWASGQPSDHKGVENYAEMVVKAKLTKAKNVAGQWNDLRGEPREKVRTGYVCQWN